MFLRLLLLCTPTLLLGLLAISPPIPVQGSSSSTQVQGSTARGQAGRAAGLGEGRVGERRPGSSGGASKAHSSSSSLHPSISGNPVDIHLPICPPQQAPSDSLSRLHLLDITETLRQGAPWWAYSGSSGSSSRPSNRSRQRRSSPGQLSCILNPSILHLQDDLFLVAHR